MPVVSSATPKRAQQGTGRFTHEIAWWWGHSNIALGVILILADVFTSHLGFYNIFVGILWPEGTVVIRGHLFVGAPTWYQWTMHIAGGVLGYAMFAVVNTGFFRGSGHYETVFERDNSKEAHGFNRISAVVHEVQVRINHFHTGLLVASIIYMMATDLYGLFGLEWGGLQRAAYQGTGTEWWIIASFVNVGALLLWFFIAIEGPIVGFHMREHAQDERMRRKTVYASITAVSPRERQQGALPAAGGSSASPRQGQPQQQGSGQGGGVQVTPATTSSGGGSKQRSSPAPVQQPSAATPTPVTQVAKGAPTPLPQQAQTRKSPYAHLPVDPTMEDLVPLPATKKQQQQPVAATTVIDEDDDE